jgi:hypothetical protein
MRHLSTLFALLLIVVPAAGGERGSDTPVSALEFPLVEAERSEIVEINTGEKVVEKDGSTHVRYTTYRSSDKTALLSVRLHAAVAGPDSVVVLASDSIRLMLPGEKEDKEYHPFARFEGTDWVDARNDSILIHEKAALEYAFKVPSEGLEQLILHVGSTSLGTIAELFANVRAEED